MKKPKIKVHYIGEFSGHESTMELNELVSWMRRYPNLKISSIDWAQEEPSKD